MSTICRASLACDAPDCEGQTDWPEPTGEPVPLAALRRYASLGGWTRPRIAGVRRDICPDHCESEDTGTTPGGAT